MSLERLHGRETGEGVVWQLEVEGKVLHVSPDDFLDLFKKAGIEEFFGGTLTTIRFDKKGDVSARVRTKAPLVGRARHVWTIKRDAALESQSELVRIKEEAEQEASSRREARRRLDETLRTLLGKKNIDLTVAMMEVKRRRSYRSPAGKCRIPALDGVQFDFDLVTRYKGKKLKTPFQFMEIEADSEEKVLAAAHTLGVTLKRGVSNRSTRSLLEEHLNGER